MHYMKILQKTIRQGKYLLKAYLLIFSYMFLLYNLCDCKAEYRKRMEIRGKEELEGVKPREM